MAEFFHNNRELFFIAALFALIFGETLFRVFLGKLTSKSRKKKEAAAEKQNQLEQELAALRAENERTREEFSDAIKSVEARLRREVVAAAGDFSELKERFDEMLPRLASAERNVEGVRREFTALRKFSTPGYKAGLGGVLPERLSKFSERQEKMSFSADLIDSLLPNPREILADVVREAREELGTDDQASHFDKLV